VKVQLEVEQAGGCPCGQQLLQSALPSIIGGIVCVWVYWLGEKGFQRMYVPSIASQVSSTQHTGVEVHKECHGQQPGCLNPNAEPQNSTTPAY